MEEIPHVPGSSVLASISFLVSMKRVKNDSASLQSHEGSVRRKYSINPVIDL